MKKLTIHEFKILVKFFCGGISVKGKQVMLFKFIFTFEKREKTFKFNYCKLYIPIKVTLNGRELDKYEFHVCDLLGV